MAISVTTPNHGSSSGLGWIINATSADASGCEELKAAPAAGLALVVEHLTINNGANAISITIGEGESVPGSVDTALIGPIAMAANTSLQFRFQRGMKLTSAKALVVDSSGAGAICIFAEGRTE